MAAPAQGYQSRNTASIADTIRRGGEIQADTTARRGAIAGQMWQRAGDAVGGFLSDLGQENWKGPERQRALEAQQRRDQVDLDRAKADLETQKAKNAAVAKETGIQTQIGVYRSRAMKQNADGTWALDMSNLRQQMEANGLGDRMDEIEHNYNLLQKDTQALDLLKKQRAELEDQAFAKMGRMVLATGATPESFAAAVAHATKNGLLTDEQVQPFIDAAEKDPAAITRIAQGLASLGGDMPTQPKRPEAGSFADLVSRKEAELKRPLTTQEALVLRRSYEATGWKPDKPTSGGREGLSPENIAASKRWKAGQLATLESNARSDLKTAVDRYQTMLQDARDPENAADPVVQKARAFIDGAKRDIYGRLETAKQRVYVEFDDMIGASGGGGGTPTPVPAPAPGASGGSFRSTYESPGVAAMKPAPSKYQGRVITRAAVESLARKYGISYEEAKSRAEQQLGVTVR